MNFIATDIDQYLTAHTSRPSALLDEIATYTAKNCDIPQMLTGPVEGQFLKMLVQITGASNILEVGLFTGYSALAMAEGLPDNGTLDTCELEQKHVDIAKGFFDKSPHGKKITIHKGPALESLSNDLSKKTYDLIFIDADKENYPAYLDAVTPLLKSGGLLIADNVLWSGAVLNPKTEADKGVVKFNQLLNDSEIFSNVMLSVRDGISLARKK